MVSMHQAYDRRLELHRAFIDEAVRRRVGHVVYLSFIGAGANASFSHARSHGATETMLRDSGLSWSAVRNGMYGDEIASWFDPDGRITGSGGEGRISFSYRPELGQAIALLLADGRTTIAIASRSRRPTPSASESSPPWPRISPATTTATSRSTARTGSPTGARSDAPEWSIEAGISYYDGVSRGEADVVSRDFEELTGTPARTVRELLELYRADLPLSRAAAR